MDLSGEQQRAPVGNKFSSNQSVFSGVWVRGGWAT